MAQSRQRGHNFAKLGLTAKKKICVCLFFVLMLHIKFPFPVSSRGSLVLQPTKGVSWGHKKKLEGGEGGGGGKCRWERGMWLVNVHEQMSQMALLLIKENTLAKLF